MITAITTTENSTIYETCLNGILISILADCFSWLDHYSSFEGVFSLKFKDFEILVHFLGENFFANKFSHQNNENFGCVNGFLLINVHLIEITGVKGRNWHSRNLFPPHTST